MTKEEGRDDTSPFWNFETVSDPAMKENCALDSYPASYERGIVQPLYQHHRQTEFPTSVAVLNRSVVDFEQSNPVPYRHNTIHIHSRALQPKKSTLTLNRRIHTDAVTKGTNFVFDARNTSSIFRRLDDFEASEGFSDVGLVPIECISIQDETSFQEDGTTTISVTDKLQRNIKIENKNSHEDDIRRQPSLEKGSCTIRTSVSFGDHRVDYSTETEAFCFFGINSCYRDASHGAGDWDDYRSSNINHATIRRTDAFSED